MGSRHFSCHLSRAPAFRPWSADPRLQNGLPLPGGTRPHRVAGQEGRRRTPCTFPGRSRPVPQSVHSTRKARSRGRFRRGASRSGTARPADNRCIAAWNGNAACRARRATRGIRRASLHLDSVHSPPTSRAARTVHRLAPNHTARECAGRKRPRRTRAARTRRRGCRRRSPDRYPPVGGVPLAGPRSNVPPETGCRRPRRTTAPGIASAWPSSETSRPAWSGLRGRRRQGGPAPAARAHRRAAAPRAPARRFARLFAGRATRRPSSRTGRAQATNPAIRRPRQVGRRLRAAPSPDSPDCGPYPPSRTRAAGSSMPWTGPGSAHRIRNEP